MKTTTLTIRITAKDKKLISDIAWMRRISMAELIVQMAREQPEVDIDTDDLQLPDDLLLPDDCC